MRSELILSRPTGAVTRAPLPRLGEAAAVEVAIADFAPTQMTVGFREVAHKRGRYHDASPRERRAMIRQRPAPIVLGPGGRPFLLDRHHWICALTAEGVAAAPAVVADDFRGHAPAHFWRALEVRGWCRPVDAEGGRQAFDRMPATLDHLQDDPFRSLASALRRRGGLTKAEAPFSEFAWADVLRRRLDRTALADDFEATVEAALRLLAPERLAAAPG